jgi:DNA-binding response OmpR family regulator
MKILVVDDDLSILRLYKEELEEDGYAVVTASTGVEAMEQFNKETPDLLRQMKEKRPRMPVIMSTAYDYRDDFSVWASEAYIVKSADLTEFKATIKRLVPKE